MDGKGINIEKEKILCLYSIYIRKKIKIIYEKLDSKIENDLEEDTKYETKLQLDQNIDTSNNTAIISDACGLCKSFKIKIMIS